MVAQAINVSASVDATQGHALSTQAQTATTATVAPATAINNHNIRACAWAFHGAQALLAREGATVYTTVCNATATTSHLHTSTSTVSPGHQGPEFEGGTVGADGACVFPFTYQGITHLHCSNDPAVLDATSVPATLPNGTSAALARRGWCAFDPVLQAGRWGFCTPECPGYRGCTDTNSIPAKDLGARGSHIFVNCHGDCNRDGECKGDLQCFQQQHTNQNEANLTAHAILRLAEVQTVTPIPGCRKRSDAAILLYQQQHPDGQTFTQKRSTQDSADFCVRVGASMECDEPGDANTAALSMYICDARTYQAAGRNISVWKLPMVTQLSKVFAFASAFNEDINGWQTQRVTRMDMLFYGAEKFNQSLREWDTSSTTTVNMLFGRAKDFNGDVSTWDVSSVVDFKNMMQDALSFNGDISRWDVSQAVEFTNMFFNANAFDGRISAWDVSNVVSAAHMFNFAASFNGDINTWKVDSLEDMANMFAAATSFDQDLGLWNVSKVRWMRNAFGSSGLSLCNKARIMRTWQGTAAYEAAEFKWDEEDCERNAQEPCRDWEKSVPLGGGKSGCHPAMWVDFSHCFVAHVLDDDDLFPPRSKFEQLYASHVPEQISIEPNACTYLPEASIMLQGFFAHAIDVLLPYLKPAYGITNATHNIGPKGPKGSQDDVSTGVSVMAVYPDDNPDHLRLEIKAGRLCGAQDLIKLCGRRGRQAKNCDLEMELTFKSHRFSLRNVSEHTVAAVAAVKEQALQRFSLTAGEMGGAEASTCVHMGLEVSTFDIEEDQSPIAKLLKLVGIDEGEPSPAVSWFNPNTTLDSEEITTPPTITCPPPFSLEAPFRFEGVEPTRKKRGEHHLNMDIIRSRNSEASDDGGVPQGDNKGVARIAAKDKHNVSRLEVLAPGVVALERGMYKLPSDFQGAVVFRATNLLGRTANCTTNVTTFKPRSTWNSSTINMKSEQREQVQNRSNSRDATHLYYVDSTYIIDGPAVKTVIRGEALDAKKCTQCGPMQATKGNSSNISAFIRPPAPDQLRLSPIHEVRGHAARGAENKAKLFKNWAGESEKIVYQMYLTPKTNTLVYLDQDTGGFIISPKPIHVELNHGSTRYTGKLVGRDQEGAETVLKRFTFVVKMRPEFTVKHVRRKTSNSTAAKEVVTNVTQRALEPFAVGKAFQFAPIALLNVKHAKNVTYTIKGGATSADIFINPTTGEVQGLVDAEANHTFILEAINEFNAVTVIERATLQFRKKDVEFPKHGPGGSDCANGKAVDNIAFDEDFVCDCSATRFSGPNCGAESDMEAILGSVIGVVAFLLLFALVVNSLRRYWEYKKSLEEFDFLTLMKQWMEQGDLDSALGSLNKLRIPREIKRSCVQQVHKIGEGNFGEVWIGKLDESDNGGVPGFLVAIKVNKEKSNAGEQNALEKEAAIMAQVPSHENLVSIIGVVTSGEPMLLLVSYCAQGSLEDYLVTHEGQVSVSTKLRMGAEIACGMGHLAEHHFVHRDLAARNVLVELGLTCKVADFGLSKILKGSTSGDSTGEYYRQGGNGMLPIRWSSPEALEHGVFGEASDVWGFGITMIEIFNDGAQPYPGLETKEVMVKVMTGYMHPKPVECPAIAYEEVIAPCCNVAPRERPTFKDLHTVLVQFFELSNKSDNWQFEATRTSSGSGWVLDPRQGPDGGYVATFDVPGQTAPTRTNQYAELDDSVPVNMGAFADARRVSDAARTRQTRQGAGASSALTLSPPIVEEPSETTCVGSYDVPGQQQLHHQGTMDSGISEVAASESERREGSATATAQELGNKGQMAAMQKTMLVMQRQMESMQNALNHASSTIGEGAASTCIPLAKNERHENTATWGAASNHTRDPRASGAKVPGETGYVGSFNVPGAAPHLGDARCASAYESPLVSSTTSMASNKASEHRRADSRVGALAAARELSLADDASGYPLAQRSALSVPGCPSVQPSAISSDPGYPFAQQLQPEVAQEPTSSVSSARSSGISRASTTSSLAWPFKEPTPPRSISQLRSSSGRSQRSSLRVSRTPVVQSSNRSSASNQSFASSIAWPFKLSCETSSLAEHRTGDLVTGLPRVFETPSSPPTPMDTHDVAYSGSKGGQATKFELFGVPQSQKGGAGAGGVFSRGRVQGVSYRQNSALLGWKKGRDVVSIYEEMGRPDLIRSVTRSNSLERAHGHRDDKVGVAHGEVTSVDVAHARMLSIATIRNRQTHDAHGRAQGHEAPSADAAHPRMVSSANAQGKLASQAPVQRHEAPTDGSRTEAHAAPRNDMPRLHQEFPDGRRHTPIVPIVPKSMRSQNVWEFTHATPRLPPTLATSTAVPVSTGPSPYGNPSQLASLATWPLHAPALRRIESTAATAGASNSSVPGYLDSDGPRQPSGVPLKIDSFQAESFREESELMLLQHSANETSDV